MMMFFAGVLLVFGVAAAFAAGALSETADSTTPENVGLYLALVCHLASLALAYSAAM